MYMVMVATAPAINRPLAERCFFDINEARKLATIKPTRNPKLGLSTACNPPVKPEKIGSPTRPIDMYTICDSAAERGLKRKPARRTKSVCNVMGTGPKGMEINAPIAVNAEKSEIKVISRVVVFIYPPIVNLNSIILVYN